MRFKAGDVLLIDGKYRIVMTVDERGQILKHMTVDRFASESIVIGSNHVGYKISDVIDKVVSDYLQMKNIIVITEN